MMIFSVVVVVVAFIWEENQFIWTVMPQSYTESPYFSKILKAGLEDIKFPRALLCCNMWMICFISLLLKPLYEKRASNG